MTDNRTPSLGELIRSAIDCRLLGVHTSIPGRVEAFDPATQTADVKPLIRRQYQTADELEIVESIPVLPGVPVAFPRAGKFKITWPVRAGDLVELVFSEVSRDAYQGGDGSEVTPDDFRRFDLSDAVAYPAGFPQGKALADFSPDHIELGTDGGVILSIHGSEIHLGSRDASDALALASKVKAELDKLQGNYDAHTHAGVTVGAGVTGIPAPLNGPVGAIASTVVKSD